MRGEAGLLQRMREGIVADVVEQGGHPNSEAFFRADRSRVAQLLQRREGPPGQMKGAEGVLEAAVGGAGVDQECVTDLADVAKALNGGRVERKQGGVVDPDVVPERIADDLGGSGGAAEGGRRAMTLTCRRADDPLIRTAPAAFPPCWLHTTGPAAATSAGTSARYCSKFSRNIVASFRAWAS